MADGRSDQSLRDEPAMEDDASVEDEASAGNEACGPPREPGTPAADASGPGARLRAARQAHGLDQDEQAQALNLPRRVIRALEEDDDEQLPGATFVRGYIRSWARLTGEPVEPLLAAYEARKGRPRPTVQPSPYLERVSSAPSVLLHRPGLVMTVTTLILVVVGAALMFALWPDALERFAPVPDPGRAESVEPDRMARERPEPSATKSAVDGSAGDGPAAEGPAADGSAADAGSAASGSSNSGSPRSGSPEASSVEATPLEENFATAPVLEAAQGSDPPATAGETPEVPMAEDSVVADRVVEVSADGSGTRVRAGGEAHLHLVFSGDCWVEIRDREDRVVHQDLHGRGQTLDLLGRAPFRVLLGYAPVVELSYNDSRVPLAPHTRNDVASLVIGR